ncbi:hypothetical protein NEHOM01_0663 [Nematocida homosporus]|uniref:uncharacterized protein n=1 Tax=Nematocida homosporus TaxID=1912981 RepID=UPI00222059BA|nr:uncharacterized protein NEHOM01_0663 [Nematocida homosporus]KAI5185205.1 hypothetical protein NEHOM01_0663 [Nematocida homosporus]
MNDIYVGKNGVVRSKPRLKYKGPLKDIPPIESSVERRPMVFCCIKEAPPTPPNGSLAERFLPHNTYRTTDLEMKIIYRGPMYLLKRTVYYQDIPIAVLDVLDIRNTFIWVETFYAKRVRHGWTEKETRIAFKAAVATDIYEKVVKGTKDLTVAIDRIYDVVYTPENLQSLYNRILTLSSAEFGTLFQYKEELELLVRSYFTRLNLHSELMKQFIRERFWNGISTSIKIQVPDLSPQMSPAEIILAVYVYCTTPKNSALLNFNELRENANGQPRTDSNTDEAAGAAPADTPAPTPTPSPPAARPRPNTNINFNFNPNPSYTGTTIPPDALASILTVRAGSLLAAGSCLLGRALLGDVHSGSRRLPAPFDLPLTSLPPYLFRSRSRLKNLVQAMERRVDIPQDCLLARPKESIPFVIDVLRIANCLGGILYQDNIPISFFFGVLTTKETQYTKTEKGLLAIDLANRNFHWITHGCPVYIFSNRYRSFSIPVV